MGREVKKKKETTEEKIPNPGIKPNKLYWFIGGMVYCCFGGTPNEGRWEEKQIRKKEPHHTKQERPTPPKTK